MEKLSIPHLVKVFRSIQILVGYSLRPFMPSYPFVLNRFLVTMCLVGLVTVAQGQPYTVTGTSPACYPGTGTYTVNYGGGGTADWIVMGGTVIGGGGSTVTVRWDRATSQGPTWVRFESTQTIEVVIDPPPTLETVCGYRWVQYCEPDIIPPCYDVWEYGCWEEWVDPPPYTEYQNQTFISNRFDVTVNSGPTSAVLGGGGNICPGGSSNLSVVITGGVGPYSFTINGYGPVTNYTSGTAIPVSPSGTTTYTIGTVTGSNGCSVSGTGSPTVTVSSPPSSAVLGTNATICQGQSTNLSVVITGGVGPYSFTINGHGPVTNYTSGTAIPVSPSVTTTYTIGTVTGSNGCGVGGTGSATITVNPRPGSAVLGSNASICVGQSANLSVTITGGVGPYSFTINGHGPVTNYTSGSPISVSPSVTTTYTLGTVTGSNGCSVAGTGSATVTVNTPPAAITSVNGLLVGYANDQWRLEVVGSADATSFSWNVPGGSVTDQGGGVPNRNVRISFGSTGSKSVSITPVKSGCNGTPFNITIMVLGASDKNTNIEMLHTPLSAGEERYLYIGSRASSYVGCPQAVGPVSFTMKFDLGDTYNWGANVFNASVNVTVTAYYDLPAVSESWPVSLVLNRDVPEQTAFRVYSANPTLLKFIKVDVTGYTAATAVTGYTRLTAGFTEENEIAVSTTTVSLGAVETSGPGIGAWERKFNWTPSCTPVTNYQYEIIRIYGTETPDWTQALSLETGNMTSQTLVLAEGSGDYKWRVRAVGTKTGGIANPQNWGPWSAEGTYTYVQPDEDRNWIYSRTFTEGNKVSEKLVYANGLQQIAQQQTRLQEDKQVVVSQTLQDYVGRNALTTLPVPVAGKSTLGYQNGVISQSQAVGVFDQAQFDTDPKVGIPQAKLTGDYYSGTDITVNSSVFNAGVADAEGYPYTRTLFTKDGTNRVAEQSGAGAQHSVVGGKTVRTFYTGVSEGELVRVFGREAPEAGNVQKIITYDANNVASVTYQNKDGKVLATSLSKSGSTGALDALPSWPTTSSDINESVVGGTRVAFNVQSTRKPLLFTEPLTTVTVNYSITPALVQNATVGGNVVGQYSLEGNGLDGSGSGNTASVLNGPTVVADNFGGSAYNLDGTNDYIELPDGAQNDFGSGDFTVSIWVKRNALTSSWDNGIAIGKWNTGASPGTNEWALTMNTTASNNIPAFFIESGTTTYTASGITNMTSTSAWYHLVGMRSGNQLKVFLNGVLEGTYTLPTAGLSVNNTGRSVWVGAMPGYFTAMVTDEIQLYNRALEDGEVQQLYRRSTTFCKTCDYKVEFELFKADDPNFLSMELPADIIITGAACSQAPSTRSFTLTNLVGGVNYVLEKRITSYTTNTAVPPVLYLDTHLASVSSSFQACVDAAMAPLRAFLNVNNMSGLYAHLNANPTLYPFDAANQRYEVKLSCGGSIYLNVQEAPPGEVPSGDCTTLNGRSFAAHFEDYYAGKSFVPTATGDGVVLPYAYFDSQSTTPATRINFTRGQLNAMIINLYTDNSGANGLLTCDNLWRLWDQEVKSYEASTNIEVNPSDLTDVRGVELNGTAYKPNLVMGFLDNVEAWLGSQRPDQGSSWTSDAQLCATDASGRYYFTKRQYQYGKIGGVVSGPDLTRTYGLVYIHEDKPDQANAVRYWRGLAAGAPLTIADFNALTVCQKYQLGNITRTNLEDLPDEQAKIDEYVTKTRNNCNTGCEGRREEFLQLVLNSIFTQTPTATVQNYVVSLNPSQGAGSTQAWVGMYDAAYNPASPTYTYCEITKMVDALVGNCKKYCKLTPQYNTSGQLAAMGTTTEWENIRKALTYQMEVQVKQSGQTCTAGWDDVLSGVVQQDQLEFAKSVMRKNPGASTTYINDNYGLIAKDDNNIYTVLNFNGTLDLDPSPSTVYNVSSSGSQSHLAASKLDGNGNFVWGKILATPVASSSVAMPTKVKVNGNAIYLIGSFVGTVDFDPSPSTFNLTSVPTINYDNFIAKYDLSGNLLWALRYGNSQAELGGVHDCTFDTQGNLIAVGSYFGTVDFDPGAGISNLTSNASSSTYLLKLTPSGSFQWVKPINMVGGYSFKITTSGSNLFLAADWVTSTDIPPNGPQGAGGFMLKLDDLGNPIWGFKVTDNTTYINGFTIDASGHAYLTGSFSGSFDFDPTSNVRTLTSNGQQDAFLSKYNISNGSLIWGYSYGGLLDDAGTFVSIATNGDIYLGGYFGSSSIDLDPSSGTLNLLASSGPSFGDYDLFFGKYDQFGSVYFGKRPLDNRRAKPRFIWPVDGGLVSYVEIYGAGNSIDFDPSASSNYFGANDTFVLAKYLFAESSSQCVVQNTICFRFTIPVTEVLIPSAVTFGKEFNPVEITQTEANAKILIDNIEDQTQALLSDRLAAVQRSYESCLDRVTESFTVTYRIGTYHHTLYYYDRAGNLMKTVPPRGVAYLAVNTPAALATAKTQYPAHTFVTSYEYNSLGQLVKQTTPDAGVTRYWYNDIGQLRFSQNAQQALDVTYSYTKYDPLGRVTEVGESTGFVEATLKANRNNNQSYPGSGMRQVTRTVYSDAFNHFALPSGLVQENYLRNRVSYSYVDEDGSEGTTTDRSYTVYNYDAHGNVKWLVQKIQTLDNKLFAIHYEYDLLSGNVLKVKYNPGESDQFYHRYEYDADNRIRAMYTSADQVVWERDARYDYYLHGPLKRTTVGEDHVQGTDYTYTIHGWLKGINNPHNLHNGTSADPGADGAAGKLTAKDAFGMVLTYYNNDYKHTGHPLHAGTLGLLAPLAGRDLYNGNIATWTSSARLPVTPVTGNYLDRTTGYVYTYDELNRIKSANFRHWNGTTYATTVEFQETLQYDANGNISNLLRYGAGASYNLDNVNPAYYANTNKMSHWPDTWTSPAFDKDVEPQAANYYTYDANGNLKTEGTASTLHWTPYGKVKQVVRTGVGTMDYKYDAAGNRVAKRRANLAGLVQTSYYVRDASGNILAEYEKIEQGANPVELYLNERSLYGSDRVGLYTKRVTISGAAGSTVPLEPGETRISATTQKNAYEGVNYLLNAGASLTLLPGFTYTAPAAGTGQSLSVRVSENTATSPPAGIYSRELNMRQYEMKDHLGNVRALVSDVKLSTLTANVPGNYEPDLKMIANYYAFGMDQPGRQWTSSGKYRYGFNGKEKDDNGEWGQTSYDYGFRIYNPALGRFLSVDPLEKEYPELTPYQFAGNRPIDGIDLDGLEYVTYKITIVDGAMESKYKVADYRNVGSAYLNMIHKDKLTFTRYINYGDRGESPKPEQYTKDFYQVYSKGFGPRGRGIEYEYEIIDSKNHTKEFKTMFFDKENGFVKNNLGIGFFGRIGDHGIYYGEGCPTYYGPINEHDFRANPYEYILPPVDEVDAAAKIHDMDYEEVFNRYGSYDGWLNDTNTIEADIKVVLAWESYLKRAATPGYKDKFTGRSPSEEALNKAWQGKEFFKKIIQYKIGLKLSKDAKKKINQGIDRLKDR